MTIKDDLLSEVSTNIPSGNTSLLSASSFRATLNDLITRATFDTLIFDTLAEFIALSTVPSGVIKVFIRAVTGTYPPAYGTEATPLWYRFVSSTTGLYGELTVAGKLWAPIYSTSPVNMGEFKIIPDGTS